MEFYRIEILTQNLEEQIDKENKEQKKQEKDQQNQQSSFDTNKIMKDTQKNMGNMKPPSIPNMSK